MENKNTNTQAQDNNQEQHEKYIKLAIDESEYAIKNKIGYAFGAVVVKDGEIVAQGHNEQIKIKDPTAHAEVQAIRKACEKLDSITLEGCVMYASCEPCLMCQATIINSKIKKVYYAISAQDLQDCRPFIIKDYILNQVNTQHDKRDIPYYQMQEFVGQAKSLFNK